jgi:hypothetical protein
MKGQTQNIAMLVAAAVLVYFICNMNSNSRSGYSVKERSYAKYNKTSGKNGRANDTVCGGMNKGTGLASSLLPREVASAEDFGQFAPEDVLKGQNFLEPRNQIGFPESIGGALRNANQQIRNEPPNPKDPFVWNNSTIMPDLMQRSLCA